MAYTASCSRFLCFESKKKTQQTKINTKANNWKRAQHTQTHTHIHTTDRPSCVRGKTYLIRYLLLHSYCFSLFHFLPLHLVNMCFRKLRSFRFCQMDENKRQQPPSTTSVAVTSKSNEHFNASIGVCVFDHYRVTLPFRLSTLHTLRLYVI